MRGIGDDSSAGSSPLPSYLDNFSPSVFLVEDEPLSPPPEVAAHAAADADDLWAHLELDGWCFNSDNHHHDQHQAASEPVRHNNGCGSRRPPRPLRGSAAVRGTNKRKHPLPDQFIHRDQECDDSVGNLNSVVKSLASENNNDEISSAKSEDSEVQSDLAKNEKRLPEIGMEFPNEDEAYKFYKKYADDVGFTVRKGKVQRLSNGAIRKRNFLCSRQGFKWRKESNNETMAKYTRKETRTGCNASVQLTVEDRKWVISSFISEHNHEFDMPKKEQPMDSFITNGLFNYNEENGVRRTTRLQSISSLNLVNNGSGNMLQPEDVQSLMNCFMDLQLKDPSFFYGVQVDAANRTTNFFWRDCRSRVDYRYFGDVVVFDTTHRVDNVIYASFWGTNHHQQCVLFGGALLLDESLESFLWLFRVFSMAMDNLQPKTWYVSYESQEIATSLETTFPKSEHRLSGSNIFKIAKRRISRYFEQSGFEEIFKKCMFDFQSEEEFELNWNSLMIHFNLHENSWLINVQKLWKKWSHLFRRNTFSAGIEEFFDSPNSASVFQNLADEIMSLSDFVQHYVKEAQRLRLEESHEDLCCYKSTTIRSRKGMEKQAEALYTRAIFKKFQEELLDSLSLAIEEETSSATISTFKLAEEGNETKYIVTFDSSSTCVSCSCGKFEIFGILCGHCIKVLNMKNIFQIPSQYILKRWTKYAKGEVTSDVEKDHTSRDAMHKTLNIITKSIGTKEGQNVVEGYLDVALKGAEEILKEKGLDQIDSERLEIDDETNRTNAIGVQHLRNNKMASISSGVNREQGSKNSGKNTMEDDSDFSSRKYSLK